jgi:hypothetical protein
MAHMNQEKKSKLAPAIKAVLKKYNAKGSISVHHHSTLIVTISESPFEFEDDYIQVNHYSIDREYSGELASFLNELRDAMMAGNHDNSDVMTEYYDVGWYVSINFGRWNKPYRKAICEKVAA